MEIIEKIKESYNKNRLVPFIGAGFSKNIPGYPNWEEFIKSLEIDLSVENGFFKKHFGDNYLEATEYWILKKAQDPTLAGRCRNNFNFGKNELRNNIKNTFKKIENINSRRSWKLHHIIVSAAKIKQIFTTNWDHALEKACDMTPNVKYHKLIYDNNFKEFSEEVANSNGSQKCIQIVKFHGDYEYDDSIIACETDYYQRMTKINCLDIKLKNEILYNDFIFLGYKFSDINIKFLFFQMDLLLNQIAEGFRPVFYFISLEKDNEPRNELLSERKGMKVFYLFDILENNFYLKRTNSRIKCKCEYSKKEGVKISYNMNIIYNDKCFPNDNKMSEFSHLYNIGIKNEINRFYSCLIRKSYEKLLNIIFN